MIIPSQATKTDIVRHLRIAPSRIAVLPWGCEERFQPTREHECFAAVRRCYHLPPRYVLFVGTLEPRKNLTTLLQAFAPPCMLLIRP